MRSIQSRGFSYIISGDDMLAMLLSDTLPERAARCALMSEVRTIFGINVLELTLPIPARPRRRQMERLLEGAEELLRAVRARSVVFCEGFPFSGYFMKRGFVRADVTALLRAKAAEIADRAPARHESVLIFAPRATAEVLRTVERLGESFHHIFADGPEGVISAAETVLEGQGAPVRRLGRDRAADVDAAVFFGAPSRPVYAAGRTKLLMIGGGEKLVLGGSEIARITFGVMGERPELPEGISAAQILSAALEAGKIEPREISVLSAS